MSGQRFLHTSQTLLTLYGKHSKAIKISHRSHNCYREASAPGASSHDAHSVGHLKQNKHISETLEKSMMKVGARLEVRIARGVLSIPESRLHINMAEMKAIPWSLKKYQHFSAPDCPSSHGQHCSYLLHEQGRWYETSIYLCLLVETPYLVQPEERHSTGMSPPRPSEQDCHRTNCLIIINWSKQCPLHQEVFCLICRKWNVPEVDLFATR